VCGWPSCVARPRRRRPQPSSLRVLGKGLPGAHGRLRRPPRRHWTAGSTAGRPRLVKPDSPPALLLGARGKRLDPRVARSVVHQAASRRTRRAGRRRRTAFGTPPQRT
jgi:hypothetical protein